MVEMEDIWLAVTIVITIIIFLFLLAVVTGTIKVAEPQISFGAVIFSNGVSAKAFRLCKS